MAGVVQDRGHGALVMIGDAPDHDRVVSSHVGVETDHIGVAARQVTHGGQSASPRSPGDAARPRRGPGLEARGHDGV